MRIGTPPADAAQQWQAVAVAYIDSGRVLFQVNRDVIGSYSTLALIICGIVQSGARAFGTEEEELWRAVEAERQS